MNLSNFLYTPLFRLLPTILLGLSFAISPVIPVQAASQGLERGGWGNRYFMYDGGFPYFIGFDLQQLVSDTGLDEPGDPGSGYRSRLDLMASYDINKVRIWLNTAWFGLNSPGVLYPWKIVGGKFDLNQWDNAYWDRLNDMVDYAATKNIIVEVSIFSVQGPLNYFKNDDNSKYAFRNINNVQGFGAPNGKGHFLPEFFNLNYTEGTQSLRVFQEAYLSKVILELGNKVNVYFELMNEAPARISKTNGTCTGLKWGDEYAPWANTMISYLKSMTTQIVNVHANGYMNSKCSTSVHDQASAKFWDEPHVDGMNFHFYTGDPNTVSNFLNSHQLKNKMLLNNEGGEYYDIDRTLGYPNFKLISNPDNLNKEIRHAWGHMTAGGYFTIYHGPVPQFEASSQVVVKALQFAQAMRHIVEKVPFQTMRPVRNDGTEYDNLVTQGPADDWQVLADEGEAYLVYFWNNASTTPVKITLPAGSYSYDWYDVRQYDKAAHGPSLGSGTIFESDLIPAPSTISWDQEAGLVLVMRRLASSIDVTVNSSSDDAEETASGSMKLGSPSLELVQGGSTQTVGLRFNNLLIPQGATIRNAYIQFVAGETTSIATNLNIAAEAVNNAQTFNSSNGNITSRYLTAATVSWSPAAWNSIGEAGLDQRTPNIASVVQEVIDRPDWVVGNSLALIINGSGKRVADSFNGNPSTAPKLHIEYSHSSGCIQSPYLGSPFIPGNTIEAEDFDTCGEGMAYHDSEPANQGGAYRPNEMVD
ncbi:MAG TPA: hypothetical protein ENJ28_05615, partial [Gammaproteobacteria bacterium]|nr:hypothetical protein [Gammaproteobacteria bacterium]